jgi:hypothetical protein
MKNMPLLSSSEMQLKLALAMVILGFEERVANETRELHDLEQKINSLQQQHKELQEQREKDIAFLEQSVRQLYPTLTLVVSQDGQVEIPAEIQRQLQQLQQEQPQVLLPEPAAMSNGEKGPDEKRSDGEVSTTSRTRVTSSTLKSSEDIHVETDIDPRAKKVIEYAFAHPESAALDWKTTVQHALQLPEPPKTKGHTAFKALQHAYLLLESMHDGTPQTLSDSLTAFYTHHFIEREQWGELKDLMLEWGVTLS